MIRTLFISTFLFIQSLSFGQVAAMLMVSEPETGGATYLLDDYPADAAYSLRLLKADHADSSAIRVRRSSDNAELDIGFTSEGYLDTASLKTFVGVNDGFVVTWYDQSGSENDATNGTASEQPLIASSGVVNRLNGEPSISFTAGNFLYAEYISNSSHSIFTVLNVAAFNIRSPFGNLNTSFTKGDFFLRLSSYFVRLFEGDSDMDFVSISGTTGQNLLSLIWDGNAPATSGDTPTDGTIKSIVNGTLYDDSANDSNYIVGGNLIIGWDYATASSRFNDKIQEIIIYTSDQSANRTAIESNINTTYSIY